MEGQHQNSDEQPSVVDLCKEFGDSTTMHGLGRALTSRSRWKRLMWSFMVLCCAGWSVFQLVKIVNKYYTYPVTSELNLNHETRMRFPAITICNINKMRSSLLPDDFKGNVKLAQLFFGIQIENYFDHFIRSLESPYSSLHKLSDLLVDCMFNGKQCTESNFTEFYDSGIESCYMFTPSESNHLYTTKAGPQNGLLLEIDIEHRDYLSWSPEAGVKIIVHDKDNIPFPEDGGILVPPGALTSIGVRKTVTHRLPPPYGSCVSDKDARSSDLSLYSGEWLKYKYAENACRKSCYQFSLYKKCNCCDLNLPCPDEPIIKMTGVTPKEGNIVPFCNTTDLHNDLFCMMELDNMYMLGELNCSDQCPPACDQNTYETTVSTALWPSDQYLDLFLAKLNESMLGKNKTKDEIKYFIRQNFLRIEIYFETLEYTEIETKPLYEWSMLLSDIGGQLGLWLGFSLLTGIELLELMIDTVVVCFGRLCKKNLNVKSKTKDIAKI